MIEKKILERKYFKERKSVTDIANELGCSQNKITYWLNKYGYKKRTISEAIYIKANPKGHPFEYRVPGNSKEWFLYGLGLGLYWGEGNKLNKHAVRLGNTDPHLIKWFLIFLTDIYQVDKKRLKFGLQIFSDINENEAKKFWCNKLKIKPQQFQKVVVTESFRRGSYTHKCPYGVLTVYFSNIKLRDTINSAIDELRN